MISRDEMKVFIQPIVAEAMPDEVEAFELEGENIISDLYGAVAVQRQAKGEPGYEFMDSSTAQMVLEFVKLLTATLGLIKVLSEVRKKSDFSEEELKRRWADEMIRAGLSKKKATDIANRFAADLATRMR